MAWWGVKGKSKRYDVVSSRHKRHGPRASRLRAPRGALLSHGKVLKKERKRRKKRKKEKRGKERKKK